MKYIVDVTQAFAIKIQRLIKKGDYESVAQFIAVAIENQLYLEEMGQGSFNGSESNGVLEHKDVSAKEKQEPERSTALELQGFQSNPGHLPSPTFSQLVLGRGTLKEEISWPWGQINKILPVKIGVRTLLRELADKSKIPLADFVQVAAEEAVNYGKLIRHREDQLNRLRDDRISAGLPKPDDEKSQGRYKAQFLAYYRKDGLMDGAMTLFRLANIEVEDEQPLIGLTKAGVEFGQIPNPVLDGGHFDRSLGKDEIAFYLSHIKNHVAGEFAGIQWILTKIKQGFNKRESLNEELNQEFGKVWNATDAVINTQRAGIMARMFELGLLEKEKKGIYVTYHISDNGKSFLVKH